MPAAHEWSSHLQAMLQQTLHEYFRDTWDLSELHTETGFSSDLWNTAFVVDDLEILNIEKTEQSLDVFCAG